MTQKNSSWIYGKKKKNQPISLQKIIIGRGNEMSWVPEEKHLERANAGVLEAQEILRALAVDDAHILSAMPYLLYFFSSSKSQSI